MTPINNNQMSEQELWEITPCPYKPLKDGLVIVDLQHLIEGYKEGKERAQAEAVRGFVDWICNIAETQMAKPVLGVGQIKSASEEYLTQQSLDKGEDGTK